MNRFPAPASSVIRPRVWAMGISRLRDLFRDIAREYDEIADLRVVPRGFEEAVAEIAAAGPNQRPDVVVAAGSNGTYLKARIDLPVVLVQPTGFDVMQALARARREADLVALVTYGETPVEVRRFVSAYGIDVVFGQYRTVQDAEACVLDLRDRGVGAVVGPGLVNDLAARLGLVPFFVYSRPSVRAAFDNALDLVQATWRETQRRQRLDSVLQHLRDGVVALDARGRVEAINQRLAAVLGIDPAAAAGQPLASLAPDIAFALPDADGESLETVRGVSYVVHRGPLVDNGVTTGAVLTFQESRAVERLDRTLRSRQRMQQFVARYRLDDLSGATPGIERVRQLARRYAKSDATVLIRGESGTGKEMIAQGIHRESPRRDFPFVAMNCGAFPEALLESELFGYEEGAFTGARRGGKVGLIEAAHRGTLFLDEIGEMPLPLQSRLLRVLQEREVVRLGATEPTRVDVRVVAATHRALTEQIEAGEFRADLFYRLNILNLAIPPLRERGADIVLLAAELLFQASRREPRVAVRIRTPEDAARTLALVSGALARHAWPGNVRELQNVVERMVVELADSEEDVLTPDVLRSIAPEVFESRRAARDAAGTAGEGALTLRERSLHTEADEIRAVLDACNGDRDRACEMLGISKTTLWRRLSAASARRGSAAAEATVAAAPRKAPRA
ncbi:propionate catabolism operon regulatory protein PrpR [Paraburkholderia silvatlantica]|uniref:Propionate catabolism operon transcriptional regulator n=1 Tax=Paraburkholderia silvatlantica TaxID=321895 RepID=A0A2U1ABM8_9BURK|nr:propionate catabolism operon regulatory protein PrpR [Paraburkholderia silvatlantica]MBB2930281.1 propionate catabolism operon transcriptional regulator [Paraburkholderia silvatlantica]PVY32110.1 propionate catabolism operon transcriptional regulator [Paraburkholderia silvatlantica]PXW37730.1 propionate catabolism operon transcriptional regulator [Paraburkholderia silvatlantica]PYE25551.1 propionate catabolism operon transcriptional regulator [Paraburkholderia silvatlantica]TDQ97806.1 propi